MYSIFNVCNIKSASTTSLQSNLLGPLCMWPDTIHKKTLSQRPAVYFTSMQTSAFIFYRFKRLFLNSLHYEAFFIFDLLQLWSKVMLECDW